MKTRMGPRKQQTPWNAAKCVVTQNLGEESPLSFWQPCPWPLGRLKRKPRYCTNTRLESPEQAYFEITTHFRFGYTQFHFCFSPTDKRKITGLVSELAETAQGGPGVVCGHHHTLRDNIPHVSNTPPLDRWRN